LGTKTTSGRELEQFKLFILTLKGSRGERLKNERREGAFSRKGMRRVTIVSIEKGFFRGKEIVFEGGSFDCS